MNERTNEWTKEGINEWMHEWMNELTDLMNELLKGMNEWMNESINQSMNQWYESMNQWNLPTSPSKSNLNSPVLKHVYVKSSFRYSPVHFLSTTVADRGPRPRKQTLLRDHGSHFTRKNAGFRARESFQAWIHSLQLHFLEALFNIFLCISVMLFDLPIQICGSELPDLLHFPTTWWWWWWWWWECCPWQSSVTRKFSDYHHPFGNHY